MMRETWRRRLLVGGIFLWVLAAVPGATAASYTGPGQTGLVPVGEGGLTVPLLGGILDDHAFAAIDGVPDDSCRLVLDENGTYADARLTWAPGGPAAYVWAEAGATDVPYRLHAVWRTDLNGACTVEATEDETYWHDPRGRPFVELTLDDAQQSASGPAGGPDLAYRFVVHNNGTIPTNVSATIANVYDRIELRSDGRIRDVSVGPLDEVAFVFHLSTEPDVPPGRYITSINFTSDEGWHRAARLFLDLERPEGGAKPDPGGGAGRSSDPLADPTVAPEEAPAPVLPLVIGALFVAVWMRRSRIAD